MIASPGIHPSFLERLTTTGYPILQCLLLLLLISFVLGAFALLRRRLSPLSLILIVWAPAFIGCILAVVQSLLAERIVTYVEPYGWSHPERFIGHIRLYLALGTGASFVLLCTYLLSPKRLSAAEPAAVKSAGNTLG